MVKKLIKHELNYYARTLIIFLPIMLLLGLMVRIFSLFESNWIGYYIAIVSSIMLLYLASIAIFIIVFILSIVRFYKNMYSQEGYLTFTLPVTTFNLIFTKLVGSVVSMASALISVILAWLISGVFSMDIFNELIYVYGELFNIVNGVHLAFYILEGIIFLIVVSIYSNMLMYTCITIGQTAKKNRILLAVGAYFIYYTAVQVLATILMIVITIFGVSGAFDFVGSFVVNNPYLSIHLLLIFAILLYSSLVIGAYYIIQNIINKKLNLE